MIAAAIASAFSSSTKWPPSEERVISPPNDERLRLPVLQIGVPFRVVRDVRLHQRRTRHHAHPSCQGGVGVYPLDTMASVGRLSTETDTKVSWRLAPPPAYHHCTAESARMRTD